MILKALNALLIAISLMIASSNNVFSSGSFTIDGLLGEFYSSDASTPVPIGSVGILVADIDGSGFADQNAIFGSSFNPNSSLGSSSNVILDVFSAEDLGGFIGFNFGTSLLSFDSGISTGNQLAFYWFPSLGLSDVVSAGDLYGFFRTDEILSASGADSSWLVPSSGFTINLSVFLDSITSSADGILPSTLSADLTAVPEPSTYAAIVGLLALALVGYRRLRK